MKKCVTCQQDKKIIGIAINKENICADCLMDCLVKFKFLEIADKLNNYIVSAKNNENNFTKSFWFFFQDSTI